MSAPTQQVVPTPVESPAVLWQQVQQARTACSRQRSSALASVHNAARAELLNALEAYAAVLTSHGRPIPYALRDELSLMRLTRGR